MFTDFFNHKCDIYHLKENNSSIGFGFDDTQNIRYDYHAEPDLASISCHFHIKTNTVNMSQGQPFNEVSITRKLSLPYGTDVRVNDKVVDCDTGIEYTAQIPSNVQEHHTIVTLIKTATQKIL